MPPSTVWRRGRRAMRHILVAERDADVRGSVATCLREEGHRVSLAGTLSDAVAVLSAARPDAVIVDAALTVGGGLRLVRQAVQLEVPALITTGDAHIQQRLDHLGCPYLTKPLCLERLRDELRATLRGAILRQSSSRVL